MYLLIEGDKTTPHKIIYFQLESAMTRRIEKDSLELWELVGMASEGEDVTIGTFESEEHAYKALRQIFDIITRGDEEWDVIEFKKYLESDAQDDPKPHNLRIRSGY